MSDQPQKIDLAVPPSPFERIKRVNSHGDEYWSARDLAKVLGYSEYGRFENALTKAEIACENSGYDVEDHFEHTVEPIVSGKGATREFDTVHLSRYACYLVVQNSDPSKQIVALGQTYFAAQTHRQELADQTAQSKPVDEADLQRQENEHRLVLRSKIRHQNSELASTARNSGVVTPSDFAIFQNHGYRGLYNGLDAQDIHRRKKLKKTQHILDHMSAEELAANLFRSTQAEAKLRRDQVQGQDAANRVHYEAGKVVRRAIAELGGTMPESLPTVESIKQLESQKRKQLSAPKKKKSDQTNRDTNGDTR